MSAVRLPAALAVLLAGGIGAAGAQPVRAVDAAVSASPVSVSPGWASTISAMPLPGGLRGALAVLDDPVPPDRSQFLVEVIRRAYLPPIGANRQPQADLASLVAYLDRAGESGASSHAAETVPLPLSPAFWIEVVFGGRATVDGLARAIVGSRPTALLYVGLLSLDDATRAWLAGEPLLVAELLTRHSSAFLLAAPGLRVAEGSVRAPGGETARRAWESIVGRPTTEPARFVRALVGAGDGRLAYFMGAMATLTPPQLRYALSLDSRDPAVPVAALRRLHAVFTRVAGDWDIERRTFRRPVLDPVLLVAGLDADEHGRPVVSGTRLFWEAVFAEDAPRPQRPGGDQAYAMGDPADPGWLCDRVFEGGPIEHRRRYDQVLFASRVLPRIGPDTAGDAVDVVRAVGRYPALVVVLERLGVRDAATLARVVRRADRLSSLDDDTRAVRALAQFQGVLAIVSRAASRGSLSAEARSAAVSSLADVEPSRRGDYEGRVVRWLDAWVHAPSRPHPAPPGSVDDHALGPVERAVLRLLAGPVDAEPRFVDWEGTRYRVDLSAAEALRVARQLGPRPRPYLSSARALVTIAEAHDDEAVAVTPAAVERDIHTLAQIARDVAWDDGQEWRGTDAPAQYREAAGLLQRGRRSAGLAGRQPRLEGLATLLRLLADELLARGLMEIVYATALGQPDAARFSASDAARRHDFGVRVLGGHRDLPWQLPIAGGDRTLGWRVVGSVLGLDAGLAEFALVRRSARLPPRKPTLSDEDRRVFVAGVVLVEPQGPTDADRDRIVSALRRGRARLAAVQSPADAAALADELGLTSARRSLLPWVVAHDPGRLAAYLSPSELLWLGLDGAPVQASLHAWGTPAGPRLGCLCLQVADRLPWERYAGRWGMGLLASTFPDLNLRLAELLAELQMPARLLGPVLTSATLDLVNMATGRDDDDRRGLVEFVLALRVERVEEYLALLTTDGPLVAVGDAAGTTTRTGVP